MFGPGFDSLQLHLAGQLDIFEGLSFFIFFQPLVCIVYFFPSTSPARDVEECSL